MRLRNNECYKHSLPLPSLSLKKQLQSLKTSARLSFLPLVFSLNQRELFLKYSLKLNIFKSLKSNFSGIKHFFNHLFDK